jgi:hypothetical protein
MGKVTKAQAAVLQAAFDHVRFGIGYDTAFRAGGNGSTLAALERRGYLTSRTYANGQIWEITAEGAAILRAEEETR